MIDTAKITDAATAVALRIQFGLHNNPRCDKTITFNMADTNDVAHNKTRRCINRADYCNRSVAPLHSVIVHGKQMLVA